MDKKIHRTDKKYVIKREAGEDEPASFFKGDDVE